MSKRNDYDVRPARAGDDFWWVIVQGHPATKHAMNHLAARCAVRAYARGIYIGPRDALEMAWRVARVTP